MLNIKSAYLRFFYSVVVLLFGSISLTSCEIIGDIFRAGVWTGIFLIVLVVALIIYIFTRFRRRD